MAKVAVLVVHGIGWHDDGTRRGLVDQALTRLMDPPRNVALLREALGEVIDPSSFVMELANWGKAIEPVQERFEQAYADLRWDSGRRIAISALGDAAQYSAAVYSKGETSFPTHDRIHGVVAATLSRLADACGPDAPLVVVAHSLGGHIASNHAYDEQKAMLDGKNDQRHGGIRAVERMATLSAFVTIGCNIPLFVMGVKTPTPIALGGATWLNYYDPDDVLGYPLVPLYFPNGKPLGYDLRDIAVEVGGIATGRTPLSHAYYWDNDVVVKGIADRIEAAANR